ncbi:DBH-like monooxygenase protein 1 [Orchesella cincta]|uniref:DBH-like monooxygenase protein 1 n=1 Tax=Orchesella cincta TaxID=48709 RepID=A0A1D2MWE3_ORCCI|nr:DBH-like monooxygenase protein 1 [Orchesella cincta]
MPYKLIGKAFLCKLCSIVIILIALIADQVVISERIFPGNSYSHREVVDQEGNVLVEWVADPKNTDVIFNITAKTRGYVSLGFSKTGKMTRSDIVIGGVGKNRVPYLTDRHTIEGRIPIQDIQQDWKLIKAWENGTHTSIKIMRKMETCDPQDYPITDDTVHLMWAFGEDDTIDYHFKNRGSFQVHLLQPDLTPQVPAPSSQQSDSPNMTGFDVWRLSVSLTNSNITRKSNPWCVFQKGPELEKKSYIIGFSTLMNSEAIITHLDRLVIYKCFPKPESNAEEYSGSCQNATELYSYCKDIIYTWGRGGKDIFLPKNTGIPFGVQSNEHYLVEAFLGNPIQNGSEDDPEKMVESREFNVDTDLLLTETARKYETKIMRVGQNPMHSSIIPSGSLGFEVFGHCASECTERMIPKRKAIRVFGVSFDTGQSGKSVTLHQVRNANQIPLVLQNGNHDPSFQQMHILREETPIRPGDQITVRCTFDSTSRTSISSSNVPSQVTPERCLAYLWYNKEVSSNETSNKQAHDCTSVIHPGDFGQWISVNAPATMKRNIGSELENSLMKLNWTPRLRQSLYNLYKFGRYRSSCGTVPGQQKMNTTIGTTNINRSSSSIISFNRNQSNNGITKAGASSSPARPKPAPSSSSATPGEITVYPLPVEEIPYTMGCPTLGRPPPVLLGPPGPVIFGF